MERPDFRKAAEIALKHEGVWSDHHADTGGKTKYGVTHGTLDIYQKKTGKLNGRKIKDLTRDEALVVYEWGWWIFGGLRSGKIANRLFDISINCEGPFPGKQAAEVHSIAVRMLQQAVNLVGEMGYLPAHLKREDTTTWLVVDGVLGPNTIRMADIISGQSHPSHGSKKFGSGEEMLYRGVTTFHIQRYVNLMIGQPSRLSFLYGWMSRALD